VRRQSIEIILLEAGNLVEQLSAVAIHPGTILIWRGRRKADEAAAHDDVGGGILRVAGERFLPDFLCRSEEAMIRSIIACREGLPHLISKNQASPGQSAWVIGVIVQIEVDLADAALETIEIVGDPSGKEIFADPGVDGNICRFDQVIAGRQERKVRSMEGE
jgi:hypothetical protein